MSPGQKEECRRNPASVPLDREKRRLCGRNTPPPAALSPCAEVPLGSAQSESKSKSTGALVTWQLQVEDVRRFEDLGAAGRRLRL